MAFMGEERFRRAYRRGFESPPAFDYFGDGNPDPQIEWRVHIACWAATHAAKLPGDFVEDRKSVVERKSEYLGGRGII